MPQGDFGGMIGLGYGGGGGISGSGTPNLLAKFVDTEEVGDSRITDNSGLPEISVASGIRFPSDLSTIEFGDGSTAGSLGYNSDVGPVFNDHVALTSLTFNLQSLSAPRTATWPNKSGTVAMAASSLTDGRFLTANSSGNIQNASNLEESGSNVIPIADGTVDLGSLTRGFRQLYLDSTITAPATTGDQEINKSSGSVNFAALATTLVVTCNKCTENSFVFAVVATDDSTATIKNVVAANGSFTIKLGTGATAETRVNFWVLNQ